MDAYYFSFSYGFGFPVTMLGSAITLYSMNVFGKNKIQYYVLAMNLLVCVMSLAGSVKLTLPIIIAIFFLYAVCLLMFAMYFYLRCYVMVSPKVRIAAYVGYFVTFVAHVLYVFSRIGMIRNFIDIYVLLAFTPVSHLFGYFLLSKVMFVIKSNPMYASSGKQTRLLKISMYTLICSFLLVVPCAIITFVGVFYRNGFASDACFMIASTIALVYSVSNMLMMVNKSVDEAAPKVTGMELLSNKTNSSGVSSVNTKGRYTSVVSERTSTA